MTIKIKGGKKVLKANRTHRITIVPVIIAHFTVAIIEVEVPSIINVLVIQGNRPIITVVSNFVDFTIFRVTNGREEQELNIGHYL